MKVKFTTMITSRRRFAIKPPTRKREHNFWTEKELVTLINLHNDTKKTYTAKMIAKELPGRTPAAINAKLSQMYHDKELMKHLGFDTY